jgi:amino acid adenylation domain-containing protein
MTLPKVSGLRNCDVPVTVKLASATICSPLIEKLESVSDTLRERNKTQIWEWNQSPPESVESCVHEVFEQQVHARPHSPAICSWDGELSYDELEELSTRLAHYLVSLGIGPEMSVPLFFDKSMWAVVAMLGILKAGGVCVSLNTTHPMVRLECIIRDVGASVVLVSGAYGHRFDHMVKSVVVEQTLFHDLAVNRSAIRALVKPTNLAFIVFTSGSTGRPKGIMLEHRSVCTSARARGIAVGINHKSRVLQFAAYSFDVSISDIFITLMHGGCVCVPSEYDRLHSLTTAINTMRVNQTHLTPTVAELLRPSEVPSLKVLSLGGELMKPGNVSVWAGSVDLHNVYGPSECTIDCAANVKLKAHSNPASIGHGMGALLWITDSSDYNQLAPVGSVGELLVEGPVVARGYLNEAEKTANAFVTNPAWIQDGSGRQRRMYKTGDLVQYASDGSITFIGRKDTQIKLRGQRLELGEIEYHLSRHSAAAALSLVVLPKKGPYYRKLVAVFQLKKRSCELPVTSDDIHLVSRVEMKTIRNDISQMFNHLKKQLPESLVPTVWICIEKIPLLPSAKIDRLKVCSWLECLTFDELCAISGNSGGVGQRIPGDEQIALAISGKLASLVASGNAELRASLEGQDILLCLSGLDSITSITLMDFIRRTYHVAVRPERFFRS